MDCVLFARFVAPQTKIERENCEIILFQGHQIPSIDNNGHVLGLGHFNSWILNYF